MGGGKAGKRGRGRGEPELMEVVVYVLSEPKSRRRSPGEGGF